MFLPASPPIPIPPRRELAWNVSVDDLLVEIIKNRNNIDPVTIQKILALLKKEITPEIIIDDYFEPGTPPLNSLRPPRTSHL